MSHHCSHHDASGLSEGRLKLSIGLTFGFVLLEILLGLRAHSLALVSDAGHNFTDGLALVLSWFALWIARKPATPQKTYGYHRVGILTALINAVTLLLISFFIFGEAWTLFHHPEPVASLPMIVVASVAVLMNTVIALWLRKDAHHDLNMRSAYIHMAGDALSAAGVVVAGLVIRTTGWVYADPLISILIGVFIAVSSWGILVETVNVLLEGAPRGMDMDRVAESILAVPGVADLHDLHVWSLSDGMNALSCHLRVHESATPRIASIVRDVKAVLAHNFDVNHSTIETHCSDCTSNELYCQMTSVASRCDHNHP